MIKKTLLVVLVFMLTFTTVIAEEKDKRCINFKNSVYDSVLCVDKLDLIKNTCDKSVLVLEGDDYDKLLENKDVKTFCFRAHSFKAKLAQMNYFDFCFPDVNMCHNAYKELKEFILNEPINDWYIVPAWVEMTDERN